MAIMKYKDPVTGEIKKVGAPAIDAYSKGQVDAMLNSTNSNVSAVDAKATQANNALATKAPAYSYGTTDLTAGVTTLETGKLHFVYE